MKAKENMVVKALLKNVVEQIFSYFLHSILPEKVEILNRVIVGPDVIEAARYPPEISISKEQGLC